MVALTGSGTHYFTDSVAAQERLSIVNQRRHEFCRKRKDPAPIPMREALFEVHVLAIWPASVRNTHLKPQPVKDEVPYNQLKHAPVEATRRADMVDALLYV